MCRFQKEINSKILEKKALETTAQGPSHEACFTESTEDLGSNPGPSCDKTSGVTHTLDDALDGHAGRTDSLEEGSSEAEPQHHSGGESVGAACLHDLRCCARHGLCPFVCLYNHSVQFIMQCSTFMCHMHLMCISE